MKWINIEKATKLEFNLPVFTKDKEGNFGLGRLMEKKHTAKGIEHRFEMAEFIGNGDYAEANFSTEITHVAKPH